MNPQDKIPRPEESLDAIVEDAMSSVDDFIRELEAKERDLHISSDLEIEVEQSEYDPRLTNEVAIEPAAPEIPMPAEPIRPSVQTAAARPERGLKTRVFELEREAELLNDRIRQLKAERNEIQEKSDRRLKDFESFKYRMDRERRGAFIDQIANLAGAMLPVLDNLDRALGSVDRMKVDEHPEFSKFYDGIALVNHQVSEVLAEMGVEPIKTIGSRFDPELHEAVATEDRTDIPNNSISEEMLRGYRIGNRVIRHSMVKVTLGGPAYVESSTTQDTAPAGKASADTSIEPVE
ncbi:MAG TPA: nucleotide exchange factor GrpE [Pyrinomonadaceae bacterium]|nr:nucleotide exchange factor GrpE [Pyrinomonadaceae bacterium]